MNANPSLGLAVLTETMIVVLVTILITSSRHLELLRFSDIATKSQNEESSAEVTARIKAGPGTRLELDGVTIDSESLLSDLELREGKTVLSPSRSVDLSFYFKLRLKLQESNIPYVETPPLTKNLQSD